MLFLVLGPSGQVFVPQSSGRCLPNSSFRKASTTVSHFFTCQGGSRGGQVDPGARGRTEDLPNLPNPFGETYENAFQKAFCTEWTNEELLINQADASRINKKCVKSRHAVCLVVALRLRKFRESSVTEVEPFVACHSYQAIVPEFLAVFLRFKSGRCAQLGIICSHVYVLVGVCPFVRW